MTSSARSRGPTSPDERYVFVAGFDVQAGFYSAFEDWWRSQYAPSLETDRGWQSRLYRCVNGEPSHLMFSDSPEAPAEELLPAPFRASPFSRRIRDYFGAAYRRILAQGPDPRDAELINLIRVQPSASGAQALSLWYSEVHVPEILACPGWIGAERYESLGQNPEYLAMYGLEDEAQPFHSPEYERAVGWDDHEDDIRGYHGFRIYRRLSWDEDGGQPG